MKTRNFAEVIGHQLANDPELRAEVGKAALNAEIARLIYTERERAKLTQAELAEKVGTKQSVIARLEDADYGGHSLTMLWRIADALDRKIRLKFEPEKTLAAKGSSRDKRKPPQKKNG